MKQIKYIVLGLLIILPITDLIFKTSEIVGEETNRYSFYIRIVALLLMSFFLLWNINSFMNIFRNPVVGAIGILLTYMLVHFVFTYESGIEIASIVRISYLFISFFFFYLLALNDDISEKDIRWLYALMAVIVFITIMQYIPLRSTRRAAGLVAMADNKGYTLVTAFPVLLLFYKKKIFPFLVGLISIGVLIAAKRGAIVCLVVSMLLMYLFSRGEGRRLTFTTCLYGLLGLVGFAILFFYLNEYIQPAIERMFAITEDGGSGRSGLYQTYWKGYLDSNSFHLILGHGLYAGPKYLNISYLAHSDWLEILFDYGFLGAVLYLNVFVQLFRYLISDLKRQNRVYYYILFGMTLIMMIKSIISSTFLMSIETIWIYIPIAFVLGNLDRKRLIGINI